MNGVMVEEKHTFTTPNLTPDPKTGHIVHWTEEQFVQRFKAGTVFKGSPMSWDFFARMNERDVKAIYRFLQSLDPVENEIKTIVQVNAPAEPD